MKKILVLEGGFNEEHEISLNTSKEVQKSLERMKFKFEVLQVNPLNFPEKIAYVHYDCHKKIHDNPNSPFIQYSPGDSRKFYSMLKQKNYERILE